MDALAPTRRTHKHRRKWGPGGKKGFNKGDRRGGQESFIDLYNRAAAQYGSDVAYHLTKAANGNIFAVYAALSWISDDLDLWFEATRQRASELRLAERLALECWLWETHDRQKQKRRYKPNKSPTHDEPWPNPPLWWALRRWFANRIWSGSKNPPQISIARALNQEREKARAGLATEVPAGVTTQRIWQAQDSGWWEDTSLEPINERNHPKPTGFWSVARNPITERLLRKDRWDPPRWEPYEDDPGPRYPFDATIYVVNRADDLAARKAECRRRCDAAIDGLLSNFGCDDLI